MNIHIKYVLTCLVFLLTACSIDTVKQKTLKEGIWRAVLKLPNEALPFNFKIIREPKYAMYIINGEENIYIPAEQLTFRGDSVCIQMHIFDTQVSAYITENQLRGQWRKFGYKRGGYAIPFFAQWNDSSRFQSLKIPIQTDIRGTWDVSFYNENRESEKAIGIFDFQENGKLTGTFLTPTGDYRYLQGNLSGDQILLSCFDGEHAFLFKATIINKDSLNNGIFYSGKHWEQTWSAHRDEYASLPDPNTLTYLKEGYSKLAFVFPNLNNNLVSLKDDRYKNKVKIVQLFGSWCPNCMDETAFLSPFYKKYKNNGLEIIGLAYERTKDFAKAKERIQVLKKRFNIEYELLYAGSNKKEEAAKTLPMLNKIIAFPTTIFIDKKDVVRKIHTGFSGPGTGKYYQQTIEEITLFAEKLLREK